LYVYLEGILPVHTYNKTQLLRATLRRLCLRVSPQFKTHRRTLRV